MKHQPQGGGGGKPDFRLHAPASARNREPILHLIQGLIGPGATVLEVGSGSGEHAVYVAQHMPKLVWQPSDPDPTMRASVEGWIAHAGTANVRPPLAIDCAADDWWTLPDLVPDLIVAINLTHVVTQPVIDGLLAGAGRLLRPGGLLALYGPFRFNGDYTSQSNKSFDIMLAQQNRDWGLRDLNNIAAAAAPHDLALKEIVAMPSNNHTLVLKRGSTGT